MRTDWLPFVLQTSDPLFPTGAYAHSLGLEEIVRFGVVHDEGSLRDFLQTQIIPALASQELPYLRFAHAAATVGDGADLCALDYEISAWKICRELREASMQLGQRRLKMLSQLAPNVSVLAFAERLAAGGAHGHHLVVCGLQYAATPLEAALGAYFYQALAACCAASLKLVRVGQEACQRVLTECLKSCASSLEVSLGVERERAGWFNPLLEIASMRHERAEERLFIS